MQDVNHQLFTDSVLEEVMISLPEPNEDKALKILESVDLVCYKERHPMALSGGQKQRLTIARALVAQPEILILDDSASALDFATDASLRKSLKEETKNMTVIMVSQRVGTVRYADKIIVLDKGELVGIGKHNDLFNSCSVYKEICLSQLKAEEVLNK